MVKINWWTVLGAVNLVAGLIAVHYGKHLSGITWMVASAAAFLVGLLESRNPGEDD